MQRFKDWLNQPFNAGMDVFHWWLFFGLVIIIFALWGIILRHITEGLE